MAGQAPYSDSDYGFSLPHLLGVAGLLAGMGIFFLIPSSPGPERIGPVRSKVQSAKGNAPSPIISDASPDFVDNVRRSMRGLRPAVAERFKSITVPKPKIVAAVAQKPPVQPDSISSLPEQLQQTEYDLESELANNVPTVGLTFEQASIVPSQIRSLGKTAEESTGPEEGVLALLDDTTRSSLPFQEKSNCKLPESTARALGEYSRKLHTQTSRFVRTPPSLNSLESMSHFIDQDSALASALYGDPDLKKAEAIPALLQVLQVESQPVRERLIEILAKHEISAATRALAHRAVFDLSPGIRERANNILKTRSSKKFLRKQLLEALRYPWPRAAWHAAEALIVINDVKAVPDLITMLDAPNPKSPFRDSSGKMMVRELVRINHFQNCFLCHAPARSDKELVAGVVPIPGRPINPVYYGSSTGSGNVFVRADLTYLRQDFSVMHDVNDTKPWPERQRFDYLVRTRAATAAEIAAWEKATEEKRLDYPQRMAVLYALRKLTGKDAGNRSEDWQALLD